MGLKLLCIVAHPDDECFAFGGALALAADRGVESYVICLTDGQAATSRGDATCGEELGRMRRQEFVESCKVLGVTRHELLDYQDARLEYVNFSQTAGRLVEKIRSFKPDVLLTFGQDGGLNTHPDHTMVSCLTSAAYHWAASAKRFPELGPIHAAARFYTLSTDYFMDDRPAPLPSPWTVILDVSTVLERKREAFRRHTSQAPLMERTKEMFDRYGQSEYYTLAGTTEAHPARQTTDLFAGLED